MHLPEGITSNSIQSVHFSIVLAENRTRSISSRQRQQKQPNRGGSARSESERVIRNPKNKPSDAASTDGSEPVGILNNDMSFPNEESPPSTQTCKRKRPITLVSKQSLHDPVTNCLGKKQKSCTVSGVSIDPTGPLGSPEFQLIQDLIDAAVRLSVFGTLRGSTSGCKIKANTFSRALAEIAPALWRPGYINVGHCS